MLNEVARIGLLLVRYWHTVRYLRPSQIVGRLYHAMYRPPLPRDALPRRRAPVGRLVEGRRRRRTMLGPDSFCFLNQPGRVLRPEDWNDSCRDKLWLYNLHYFDDLNAEGAERRRAWHEALIRRWIQENPPTSGNGWEPYPTSLRVVNWIKWDLQYQCLDAIAVASLVLQLRWLRRRIEHHLLGNHILSNAKALVFGGLYFQGPEADEWLRIGKQLLERELSEQILPDGGHFERSPMYHLIVLEDLLDLINICRAYDHPVPSQWLATATRMLDWAAYMQHPDGEIPFFNDAAFGIAGTFAQLRSYAERLGLETAIADPGNVFLENSGYARLITRNAVLFFDAAPVGPDYLPGHAHADTLSVELSLFGQRVLVNSGTSVYGTGPERQRQRGTSAHNTIMLDGTDSSEVWGGFRVARRAKVRVAELNLTGGVVAAEHDGYRRLPGCPMHQRRVQLTEGELVITDVLRGTGIHDVQGTWHFHPDIGIIPVGGQLTPVFRIRIPAGGTTREAVLSVEGPVNVAIEESTWHPEFGLSVANRRLVFRYRGALPVTVATRLQWSA